MKKSLIPLILCGLFLLGCAEDTNKMLPKPDDQTERRKLATQITYTSKVDILFVVDDSGSMSSHQNNLSRNIDIFVNDIVKNRILDYQIGVISSTGDNFQADPCSNGYLCGTPRFVTRSTVDAINTLRRNLLVGTSGSGTEEFFDPVMMAINSSGQGMYNQGFYRQDAFLAVVFITDAEDQSSISANDFYDQLVKLKNGDDKKVLLYGAYIPSSAGNTCARDDISMPPRRLEQLFALAKSTTYSLCDPAFGQGLAKISGEISAKVGRFIYLDRPPDIRTIKVTYGTQVLANDPKTGWIYDPELNAIMLGEQIQWIDQGPGIQVEVEFVEAEYPTPKPPRK
ncbi:MAG: hypothetical protein ACK5RO_03255 [Pseudobdellovibrionaceae bacterium]|jgi:hypothetical protein